MNTVLKCDLKAAAKLAVDGRNAPESLALFERFLIEAQLDACQGNKSRAAKRLGLHRNTLDRKIGELGIDMVEILGGLKDGSN